MSKRMTKTATATAPSAAEPSPAEVAAGILRPSVLAANTIGKLMKSEDMPLDIGALTVALAEQCRMTSNGDMRRAEAMLISQAHALNALFCTLTHRAAQNMGEYLNAADTYMRLALRAQSQCRATLETLATIKNPPVLIAKQANIAHGPQQVNNGPPAPEPSRAGESQNEPNRLLEQQHGERLDTLPTQAAGGTDPAMAALGQVHRAEVRRG
jgi:hypothetical protein